MKSFDVTNVNELNASSLELKITGNTNSLIISTFMVYKHKNIKER